MDFFEPTLGTFISLVMGFIILPFWFVKMVKGILFYVYLWQLKEYRLERFIDHFRTEKGKQIVFNKLILLKVILFLLGIPVFVLLLYGAEALKFIYDIMRRRARGPVATKKAKALVLLSIGIVFLISIIILRGIVIDGFSASNIARVFLFFDILLPVIISLVVLGLQPFTTLVRNRTLAKAKAKRATFKNLKVVGITGSYGKTSTKEFLAHILFSKYKVLKTPEHQNSEFGVANTILQKLTNEHEVFVCEMGAYKKGEIKTLAQVAQPQIGIVTGVNEQHLATFGSMENLLSAEGGKELVEVLPETGTVILNGNNEYCRTLYEKIEKPKKILYTVMGAVAPITVLWEANIKAENIIVAKNNISFSVEGARFEVPAYGGHNAQNLLGAIAAARELGMSLQEIADAAKTMPLELSPLKVKKSRLIGGQASSGAIVIDSTYSANPDGVLADLEYLRLYEGRKILIMPCLIELGSAAKEAHKKIGKKIAEVCDLAIITTKEHFEDIKQGMYEAEPRTSCEVICMETAREIFEKIKSSTAQAECAILLEGGKESRVQRQLREELFDER